MLKIIVFGLGFALSGSALAVCEQSAQKMDVLKIVKKAQVKPGKIFRPDETFNFEVNPKPFLVGNKFEHYIIDGSDQVGPSKFLVTLSNSTCNVVDVGILYME